jgi:hypothetical protein
MNLHTPVRHEFKFKTDLIHYHMLKQWVLLNPGGFQTAYPSRKINNVYFDTWDLNSYTSNIKEVSARSKLRYRWYGHSIEPTAGALEIKSKRNLYGWKFRYNIENLKFAKTDSWKTIRSIIRKKLPVDWRTHFDHRPQPVLINRYLRDYFISRNRKVMITLDTRQSVIGQRDKRYPNFKSNSKKIDSIVLEVKTDRANYEYVSSFMCDLPLVWSGYSKYVEGLNAIRSF